MCSSWQQGSGEVGYGPVGTFGGVGGVGGPFRGLRIPVRRVALSTQHQFIHTLQHMPPSPPSPPTAPQYFFPPIPSYPYPPTLSAFPSTPPPQISPSPPPSLPPLFSRLEVVGAICVVLNQSSDSIDLERVRIATADVLGVWEPRVYAASSNTPCGFHLQWCESDGLQRSLISLSHKLPGVSMSAPPPYVTSRTCYEDGVGCTAPHCSLSYTGMLCLPVTKLFTSESTSGYTVVSMSLLGYKQDDDPLGLHSVLPASPMCAAPGACDYCECGPGQLASDGCLTGQLGQQLHPSGGSGSGAGFSASAIANLSAAVGASIEFASFDSMRSSVYERMNLWKRDATISLVLLGLPAWCSLLWLLLSLARLLRRRLVAPVEALLVALLNQIEMTELRQRWRARGADPRGVDAVRWAARGVRVRRAP